MTTATVPAGRWQHSARRRAAGSSPTWYTSPDRLTLSSGSYVLATVRSNGREGAELRWLLQVFGWEWRVCADPPAYHHAKTFRTRSGAQVEADDIVAGAGEWEG